MDSIKELLSPHLTNDFEVEALTGDASLRNYYRASTKDKSYIVCVGVPSEVKEAHENFIILTKVFLENGVRVPSIITHDVDKGFILQEDLGDIFLNVKGINKIDYVDAIDQMIKIHQIDWKKYQNENFSKLMFDREKLFFEINMTKTYLLGKLFNRNDLEKVDSIFEKILRPITDEKKMVLVHRDYHSRNIMIHNKLQYVIDYQDARRGIGQYDLCSLLEDCYIDMPLELKEELKEDYFLKMGKTSKEEWMRDYDYMAIQRVFKALGTFAYMKFERSNENYLQYIPGALKNLIRLLAPYDELKELQTIMKEVSGHD